MDINILMNSKDEINEINLNIIKNFKLSLMIFLRIFKKFMVI